MNRSAFGFFFALRAWSAILPAFGETAEHQRVNVETESRHGIELDLDCSWIASTAGFSADVNASVEYTRGKSLGLRLSMPVEGEYSGEKKSDRLDFRMGDPSVSASYLWRGPGLRVHTGLEYGFPIIRKSDGGFHRFSPSLSLAIVRDPVILSWGVNISGCLPREEGGYLLWPPFSGSLSFGYWELLNDRISMRACVSPGCTLGVVKIGTGGRVVPRWSLGLAVAVAWNERNWGLEGSWSYGAPAGIGAVDIKGSVRKEW